MAKPNIHPNLEKLNVVFSNGSSMQIMSTISNGRDSIDLEISYPINHRAWNPAADSMTTKTHKYSKMSFSMLDIASGSSVEKK
jgi:ribosomal protein L31